MTHNPQDEIQLARFIDGELGESERTEMVRRLAGSSTLYELFVEVVQDIDPTARDKAIWSDEEKTLFPLNEAEKSIGISEGPVQTSSLGSQSPDVITGTSTTGPVAGGRSPEVDRLRTDVERIKRIVRKSWYVLVPATAALFFFVVRGQFAAPTMPSSTRLVGSLMSWQSFAESLSQDWMQAPWSAMRSDVATTAEPFTAFRLGVRSLDVQVAVATGRLVEANILIEDMIQLLRGVTFAESHVGRMRDLQEKLRRDGAVDDLMATSEAIEADLDRFLQLSHFNLGRWSESVRLAVSSGNQMFFDEEPYETGVALIQTDDLEQEIELLVTQIAGMTSEGLPNETIELQGLIEVLYRRLGG